MTEGSATPIVWGDQVFVVTAIKTDRVAGANDLPKIDPQFEKKTEAPLKLANDWAPLVPKLAGAAAH